MKSTASNSAKLSSAKRRTNSTKSRADLSRLRIAQAKALPTVEHPEAEIKHIVRGVVRRGLVSQPPKESISLRLDRDVLAWFKSQGPGYQTRINSVLRAFRDEST